MTAAFPVQQAAEDRNDLGLLLLVTLDARGPVGLEALPLKLEYCHTRLATGEDAAWMRRRFRAACTDLGTRVQDSADRLTINWRRTPRRTTEPRPSPRPARYRQLSRKRARFLERFIHVA
jgi:hypothetical protein